MKTFIDEQKAETLEVAARLADDYSLTHKTNFTPKTFDSYLREPRPSIVSQFNQKAVDIVEPGSSNLQGLNPQSNSFVPKSYSNDPKHIMVPRCSYCKREGHLLSDCFKLKRRQGQKDLKSLGFVTSQQSIPKISTNKVKEMKIFEPFISNGLVSLSADITNKVPIRILRDTGSSQSLLVHDILPFTENTYSGTTVLIKEVDSSTYSSVPLHKVYLSSDVISGPVIIGLQEKLPFESVHLLLGNDLAGDKVKINPVVMDELRCLHQDPDPVEQEYPDLYPACVVTRAMSKQCDIETSTENNSKSNYRR